MLPSLAAVVAIWLGGGHEQLIDIEDFHCALLPAQGWQLFFVFCGVAQMLLTHRCCWGAARAVCAGHGMHLRQEPLWDLCLQHAAVTTAVVHAEGSHANGGAAYAGASHFQQPPLPR